MFFSFLSDWFALTTSREADNYPTKLPNDFPHFLNVTHGITFAEQQNLLDA